jgi:hypothetical protein
VELRNITLLPDTLHGKGPEYPKIGNLGKGQLPSPLLATAAWRQCAHAEMRFLWPQQRMARSFVRGAFASLFEKLWPKTKRLGISNAGPQRAPLGGARVVVARRAARFRT